MIGVLGAFTALYAAALGTWAGGRAVWRRPPDTAQFAGLVLLELTLVARAVVDIWSLADGRRVPDPSVHLGYLLSSVVLLPLVLTVAGTPRARRNGWDSVVLAVGCAACAVVTVRVGVTGRPVT